MVQTAATLGRGAFRSLAIFISRSMRSSPSTAYRQKKDPTYEFDTPVPPPRARAPDPRDPLRASIGDLAPPARRTRAGRSIRQGNIFKVIYVN
jgi:hypothetical protein